MQKKWIRYAITGAAAGFVNGLFGAGGGMILVPLLVKFCKVEDKKAFASAISIILPLCLVSIATYYIKNVFPLQAALPYLIGGLVGGTIGGILFKKVSVPFLHKALGLIILWGGLKLLWN